MNSINHLLHQAWKILSSPEHKQIETRGDRFGGEELSQCQEDLLIPPCHALPPPPKVLPPETNSCSHVDQAYQQCWYRGFVELVPAVRCPFSSTSWAEQPGNCWKSFPPYSLQLSGDKCFIVQRAKPDSSFASAARELWTSTTTLSLRYPDTISREHTLSYQ